MPRAGVPRDLAALFGGLADERSQTRGALLLGNSGCLAAAVTVESPMRASGAVLGSIVERIVVTTSRTDTFP